MARFIAGAAACFLLLTGAFLFWQSRAAENPDFSKAPQPRPTAAPFGTLTAPEASPKSREEKRFSSRLLGLASGAVRVPNGAAVGRGCGAFEKSGFSAARDCQNRNAPVSSRKQAAAPAMKRAMKHLHHMGDSAWSVSSAKR